MRDDEQDDLLEELREKLELVEERITELEELPKEEGNSDDEETSAEIKISETDLNLPFHVHWIYAESGSNCSEIDTVVKAQNLFLEKSYEFDADSSKPDVLNGDVLVLLCNHSGTEPINEDNENLGEKFVDACYYVGLCVDNSAITQEMQDFTSHPQLGANFVGNTNRKILVWDTCGGEACGESNPIQLDEFKEPESGGGEEQVDSIKIVSPFGGTIKAKAHELQSMTFKKKEGGPSPENNEPPPTEYVIFKDGLPSYEDDNTANPLTGSLFQLSNIINEASDGYDVTANVNQVSLSSSSATIQDIKLNAKTYDLQKLDITSDSCGSLKREKAKDENNEEIPPEKIKLVSKSDESGSQHTISSLSVVEGSAEVSLGTLDLQSLLVTDDLYLDGPAKDSYFFTPSISFDDGSKIRKSDEIELLKDFKIEVTQQSVGENCTTITITPSTKKETYTFKSGLLTEKTADDTWVEGSSNTFTFQNCMAGCDASLTISPPNVFVATEALVGLPQGGNNEKPNCASSYSAFRSVITEPGTVYENSWSFSITKKQLVGADYFNILTYQESKISPYTGTGSAGWDSRECIITWRMPYDDQGEPAEQLNGTGKGLYTIVSSRKEEYIGDNPDKVTENFYSSNITVT